MKKIITILCLLIFYSTNAQNNTLQQEFINDVINNERYLSKNQSLIVKRNITKKGILSQNIKEFLKKKKNTFHNKIDLNDSLVLTKTDYKIISTELKKDKTIDWDKLNFQNIEFTDEENWEILALDFKNHSFLELGKPIFLKNNTIAICSEIYLCSRDCGYNYFGFYKKIDGKWKQWIPINKGYF